VAVSSSDSNSSPIPTTGLTSGQSQQAAAQQATFNLAAASNTFMNPQMPPGYATLPGYYFSPGLQAAYGAATASAQGVYAGTPMTVPPTGGGSSTSQFQKYG
jgi:hypothetical protein